MGVVSLLRTVVVVLAALTVSETRAQEAHEGCDRALLRDPDSSDPLAYRSRDDRCEGLFVRQVSGRVRVTSLHFTPKAFPAGVGDTVQLSWHVSRSRQTHVRAVSLKPKLYYRMDTLRPSGVTSYGWPTDLLERVGLSAQDVGLLSWHEVDIAGTETRLFSPISFDGSFGDLEIVLVPDVALDEIYVSLVPLDEAGRAGEYVFADKPLDYGVYPEERPISVKLPSLGGPGVYRAEINAVFLNGGTASPDVLFYYGGD